jgi:hypothetical protein
LKGGDLGTVEDGRPPAPMRPVRGASLKLPSIESAVVDPKKIRDYLLSTSHPLGRFKASFFLALGYTTSSWDLLANDLRLTLAIVIALSLSTSQLPMPAGNDSLPQPVTKLDSATVTRTGSRVSKR